MQRIEALKPYTYREKKASSPAGGPTAVCGRIVGSGIMEGKAQTVGRRSLVTQEGEGGGIG